MSDLLRKQTESMVHTCLERAAGYYGKTFAVSDIRFDLKGRAAGQVRFPLSDKRLTNHLPLIRFNTELLIQNGERFIREVVPHECAHVVVYQLFRQKKGLIKQRPKPHGIEWQRVMRDVFHLEPRVTHNFAIAASHSKFFLYHCACEQRVHQVSVIRHNKMKRGVARYLCKRCGDPLNETQVLVEKG